MRAKTLFSLLALLGLLCGIVTAAPLGTAFSYQGQLTDGANPANGNYDLEFMLYDAASNGTIVAGPITNTPVSVSNGLFTVTLDFGTGVFTGEDRWLEIGVRINGGGAFATLSPRQKITATPCAITSGNLSGALPASQLSGTVPDARLGANVARTNQVWLLDGNPDITTGFLGTTDDRSLEFRVNNELAMHIKYTGGTPNIIAGAKGNTVQQGAVGATISGGGDPGTGNNAIVGGNYGVISGGKRNLIQISHNTTIGGGEGNSIASHSDSSTISGGMWNGIGTNSAFSTISGGYEQVIDSNCEYGTIGGGYWNNVAPYSGYSTISGGSHNEIGANSGLSTIGGGSFNYIGTNAARSTIGGGTGNTVSDFGYYATIPGGLNNYATNYAFAAGRRAKATHAGAFVWADSTDADFASTGTKQFLIRANGGMGINKNNPATALDVNGTVTATAFAGNGTALVGLPNGHALDAADGSPANALYVDNSGKVGIGTNSPAATLHVAGDLRISGSIKCDAVHTGYASVAAAAFHASADSYVYNNDGQWLYPSGVNTHFYAGICLPQSATVRSVQWSGQATGSDSLAQLDLVRSDLAGNHVTMATCIFDSNGPSTELDISITNPDVDNSQYVYYLHIYFNQNSGSARGGAALITYTYSGA